MKKKHMVICLVLGILIIILSTKIGCILAYLNIDDTTEMQFCSYIDNYSASFRLLGVIVVLFPAGYKLVSKC